MRASTIAIFGAAAAGAIAVTLPSTSFANVNAYDGIIREAAQRYQVPFIVIKSLVAAESGFDPNAKAKTTSAKGLMQLVDGTAQEMGYAPGDMYDPVKAIDAGVRYLRIQINQFGLWGGLRAYYAGAGNYKNGKRADESLAYASKIYAYAGSFITGGVTWS